MLEIRHYLQMLAAAVVGISLSLFAAIHIYDLELDSIQVEVRTGAEDRATLLTRTIDTQLAVLESMRSLYVETELESIGGFAVFAEPFVAQMDTVQALEWIPRVEHADRDTFERDMRQGGRREFSITERGLDSGFVPAAIRAVYYPVSSIGSDKDNDPAWGFDVGSEPTRLAALQTAQDSGNTTASAPVRLVQETQEQQGFLVFMPVFDKNTAPQTIEDRRQHLRGFLLAVFRVPDLVDGAVSFLIPEGISYSIYDSAAATSVGPIYQSQRSSNSRSTGSSPMGADHSAVVFQHTALISIGGRQWSIVTTPDEDFIANRMTGQSVITFFMGTTVSVLLALLLLANARRAQVLGQANEELQEQISERRRMELQVQHSQKLEGLGVLAGGVAHDFNNILVGILGMAELAELDLPKDSPLKHYLTNIVSSAEQAAQLCNQLLAYSGRGRFVVEPINLAVLLDDMRQLLTISVAKQVAVNFDFAADLPQINADAGQIRQVVLNLVTNASQAIGSEPGLIHVNLDSAYYDSSFFTDSYVDQEMAAGDYVRLRVRDDGCGMDAGTQSRMFDPFYTTKPTGRGLGLAAVLGILRGHQGALMVDSILGEGTCITVLFPASDLPATNRPEQTRTTDHKQSSGTILVIDDEDAVLKVVSGYLERAGYQVLLASDGHAGIEMFNEHESEISAIILDMTMPHMNGEQVLMRIRAKNENVPVILSSGFSETELIDQVAELNVSAFIQKPYRYQALIETLEQVLRT